jgi:hypothetical protein
MPPETGKGKGKKLTLSTHALFFDLLSKPTKFRTNLLLVQVVLYQMADSDDEMEQPPAPGKHSGKPKHASGTHMYNFIPMRLTEWERKMLMVLENALEVCEYTDVVDVTFSHTKKSKVSRILESLVDILSISCGLLVSLIFLSALLPFPLLFFLKRYLWL